MKKAASIFFLFVYLLSATELSQLLKLPVLTRHYEEHCQKNSGQSFLKFLAQHYIYDDGTSQDDDTDRQLPFKQSYDDEINVMVCATFPPAIPVSGRSHSNAYTLSYSERFLCSSYLSAIWQPPRSV